MAFRFPEQFRILGRPGQSGAFRFKKDGIQYRIVASHEMGWEHVSVTLDRRRCPDWEEMCYIKSLFWDDEDCVIQYHPPKSEYISNHEFCLHLWRPVGVEIPRPPTDLIGVK